jgi:hypothetical protein
MIELNCTYEESKKILDLGYDFSKVCWKSLYEYRDQHNLNRTFIRIHVHGTGLSLTLIEDQINYQMEKYGIVDLVTPIIPKAALEGCLPDYFFAGGSNSIRLRHNSAYEAFIWCHESYQEELKAKFDEVMG